MLDAKLINFKPRYIKEILDKVDIPYECWSPECADETEIRVDIGILSYDQQKILKRITGIKLENIDYLIFF